MLSGTTEAIIQQKYEQLLPYLNEASLRSWTAVEALSWGHGGITSVSRATGLSRTTIYAGIAELEQPQSLPLTVSSRASIRQPGGRVVSCFQRIIYRLQQDDNQPSVWKQCLV